MSAVNIEIQQIYVYLYAYAKRQVIVSQVKVAMYDDLALYRTLQWWSGIASDKSPPRVMVNMCSNDTLTSMQGML